MKTLENDGLARNLKYDEVITDNSLNDRPVSKAELKKVEEAREFLKKHPVPEHLLRK